MRGRFKTISIYLISEYIFSFFVSFMFFFFVFFINHMILMAEEVLSKDVPLGQVLLLIFYSLPSIVSFSLPFAALVGALMAVGRFSSDNEVLAMQASGITTLRLFSPIVLFSLVLTFSTFMFNDYFIPMSTIKFTQLYREVLFSNPALELEPYSIKYYQDSIIVTGNVSGENISEILIIDKDVDKNRRIILAEEASLIRSDLEDGVISLKLDQVVSHTTPRKIKTEYDYFSAREMVYNILLKDITVSMRNPGPREMSTRDVYAQIQEKRSEFQVKIDNRDRIVFNESLKVANAYAFLIEERSQLNHQMEKPEITDFINQLNQSVNKVIHDRSLQIYELEFQKKLSLPFACLAFVVLAFPLGLYTKRSGRTVGFGIGVLVSVLYYGMLFAGQTLGFQIFLSPFLSMWLPNFIIFAAGIFFFIVRLRR
ncbi:MAG: LptF/LptG family permease [Spirochaetales bacterium]|nr:LptF/LptG family permease [Spirochaetales bacterium]